MLQVPPSPVTRNRPRRGYGASVVIWTQLGPQVSRSKYQHSGLVFTPARKICRGTEKWPTASLVRNLGHSGGKWQSISGYPRKAPLPAATHRSRRPVPTPARWAAAAMLEAVAEQRGWEHNRHRHYHRVASQIRAETGDGEIRRLFDFASALHENFYEDDTASDEVAERLDDVEALMDRLIPLLIQT